MLSQYNVCSERVPLNVPLLVVLFRQVVPCILFEFKSVRRQEKQTALASIFSLLSFSLSSRLSASESGAAVAFLLFVPYPTTPNLPDHNNHGINYGRRLRLTRLHQCNLQASSMPKMHAAWLAPRLLLRSSVFQEKLQSAQNNSHNCKANVRHWYYIDTKNAT